MPPEMHYARSSRSDDQRQQGLVASLVPAMCELRTHYVSCVPASDLSRDTAAPAVEQAEATESVRSGEKMVCAS